MVLVVSGAAAWWIRRVLGGAFGSFSSKLEFSARISSRRSTIDDDGCDR